MTFSRSIASSLHLRMSAFNPSVGWKLGAVSALATVVAGSYFVVSSRTQRRDGGVRLQVDRSSADGISTQFHSSSTTATIASAAALTVSAPELDDGAELYECVPYVQGLPVVGVDLDEG